MKRNLHVLKKCIKYVESERNRLKIDTNKNISKMEIAFAMYAVSVKAYSKANLYKRSAYQISKMLRLFKSYKIYNNFDKLGPKAIRSLWCAVEELNIFELKKRKKDFDQNTIVNKIPLQTLLVDSEISKIPILIKELELKADKTPKKLKECYDLHITSPYNINYSISSRIYQLRLKSMVNYEAYKMLVSELTKKTKEYNDASDTSVKQKLKIELETFGAFFENDNPIKLPSEIKYILDTKLEKDDNSNSKSEYGNIVKEIFGEESKLNILESLIAESIFCLKEIIRLSKTIGETYMFNHSFIGATHDKLSFWVRRYETYKNEFYEKYKEESKIDDYLETYNGQEWEEKLSGYYENQQALSHYYKCLETHSEGRAYHNMIDKMCYIKDDYNDRSDHFNIAEERHYILNDRIKPRINKEVRNCYKDSELYKVENYFENK